MNELLTTKEAAAVIGVQQDTVYAYCKAGILPYEWANGRAYRIPRAAAVHALHLKQTGGRYWMRRIGNDYWTKRAAKRTTAVEELEERDWTPSRIPYDPPVRDYYRQPAVHQDNGVRCVDCGGRVLDTPVYCRGVGWRCAACRRLGRPLPAPAFGPASTTDLANATKTGRRALVKSLEASTRVGYEHKSKTWRLREVKT